MRGGIGHAVAVRLSHNADLPTVQQVLDRIVRTTPAVSRDTFRRLLRPLAESIAVLAA